MTFSWSHILWTSNTTSLIYKLGFFNTKVWELVEKK